MLRRVTVLSFFTFAVLAGVTGCSSMPAPVSSTPPASSAPAALTEADFFGTSWSGTYDETSVALTLERDGTVALTDFGGFSYHSERDTWTVDDARFALTLTNVLGQGGEPVVIAFTGEANLAQLSLRGTDSDDVVHRLLLRPVPR